MNTPSEKFYVETLEKFDTLELLQEYMCLLEQDECSNKSLNYCKNCLFYDENINEYKQWYAKQRLLGNVKGFKP